MRAAWVGSALLAAAAAAAALRAGPVDICTLPVQSGPCKEHWPRFFYNATTQQCQQFDWGGCQPNGNNFGNASACSEACVQGAFSPADASDPRVVSVAQFAITAINKQLPAAQQFTLTTVIRAWVKVVSGDVFNFQIAATQPGGASSVVVTQVYFAFGSSKLMDWFAVA